MSALRDILIGWVLLAEALDAEEAMKKTHKQFNTRLGFPVTLCTPNRMSLTDSFKHWHKNAQMTNNIKDVTCANCKRELEQFR